MRQHRTPPAPGGFRPAPGNDTATVHVDEHCIDRRVLNNPQSQDGDSYVLRIGDQAVAHVNLFTYDHRVILDVVLLDDEHDAHLIHFSDGRRTFLTETPVPGTFSIDIAHGGER